MDDTITRAEHLEFAKRLEDEHRRINKRMELLEEQTRQITDIAISVRELAVSVKQMAEEQKAQCTKLEKLEDRDGEQWRRVIGYVITVVVGIVIGFVFKQFGI